jgi:carbon monoxide dehydrogenase subunit G
MKLRNEVVLAAPVQRAWGVLLDVPRVARALPGATLEPAGEAGLYRGTMRVKLGPVTMEYEGVARLQDADEDERVASFHLQGRERRGRGTAAATITNRLEPEGDRTRLIVETDLNVTGRAAQFGRGIMESVAAGLLEEFARRLEQEVAGYSGTVPPPPAEALDLGRAVRARALEGKAPLALAFTAGLVLGLFLRRKGAVVFRG